VTAMIVTEHKNCSTQIDLPPTLRDLVRAAGRAIPNAQIVPEHGRETNPHVTVLYGINSDKGLDKKIRGFGPVRVQLGEVDVFEGVEEGAADALLIRVESPDLERLRKRLLELPHAEQMHDYKPHATIAYVKPGLGRELAAKFKGWGRGKEATISTLTFSEKDGSKREVPLVESWIAPRETSRMGTEVRRG